MSAIDPSLIAKLLAGEKKARTRKPKTLVRDFDTWFELDHILTSECRVRNHEENVDKFTFDNIEAYEKALRRNRVVVDIDGLHMCRYCYISGAGLNG